MKKIFLFCLLLALSMNLLGAADTATKSYTNADVIKMVKAGLSANTIKMAIKQSVSQFDTSPDALIALASEKVPEEVIQAMIAATSGNAPAAPPPPLPPVEPAPKEAAPAKTPRPVTTGEPIPTTKGIFLCRPNTTVAKDLVKLERMPDPLT